MNMSSIVHDAFLALAALSVGGAVLHGFAWVRRRDLCANLLFSGVALLVGAYAFSVHLKIDCSDLDRWMAYSRFEFVCVFLLIPMFVETIAAATHSKFSRGRLLLLTPLLPLFVWHLVSPWGISFRSVHGLVRIEEAWGEVVWWANGQSSPLYMLLLLYVMGWCVWFLRRAWVWVRKGYAFSGWSLFGAMLVLLVCVAIEAIMQTFVGNFRFPLVEGCLLLLLVATSLLLSDEVMRIAILQRQLEAVRAELSQLNADLEKHVAERTKALQGALSELEMFSYSVSHDLRGPLRAIDGFSQAVLEEHGGAIGVDGRQNLERVRLAAQKLGTLFDDLVSLIRSGGIVPRPVEFDLSALVREVAGEMCEQFPDHDVQVEIQSSLSALSDPALLKTALRQILSNSWKFTRGTESPKVEVLRDGAWLVVRDNGAGFDPTHASKLFRPFQRLHSDAFPGNGVGLAIVRRILMRLGGDVSASGRVGSGVEIRLRIPGIGHFRS